MSTKISWADESWNPIVGCSKISAGCANCYAERMTARQMWMEIARCEKNPRRCHKDWMKYAKVIHAGTSKWNGKTHFVESALTKPLHWRKPRKIFVCSMSDLFHESVPFEWIDRVFAVIALCPQHQFMCLTKRAGRMREYVMAIDRDCPQHGMEQSKWMTRECIQSYADLPHISFPLPNVHLGVTVENNKESWRLTELRQTPAAHKFVSLEPWLGNTVFADGALDFLDCAYIGCESGPKARLCTLDDIRYVMHQCREAGVKIHVKQCPIDGKCNKNIKEWPDEFRIREV